MRPMSDARFIEQIGLSISNQGIKRSNEHLGARHTFNSIVRDEALRADIEVFIKISGLQRDLGKSSKYR